MVECPCTRAARSGTLSVLALSSRFDGLWTTVAYVRFDYLSVLALSSRFDGPVVFVLHIGSSQAFSTRSVESF